MSHSDSSSTLGEGNADTTTARRQIVTVYGPPPKSRRAKGRTLGGGRVRRTIGLKKHGAPTCPCDDLPEARLWWPQSDHYVVPSSPCSKHERQLWIATKLESDTALISLFVDIAGKQTDIFAQYKLMDGNGPIPHALACLRDLRTIENLANTEGNTRRWEWRYCVAIAVCDL
jgi:hypothetical protein